MSSRKIKILGLLIVCVCCWFLRQGCLHMRDVSRRASCRPKCVYMTCKNYAEDNNGIFPPVSPIPGMLFYDVEACKGSIFSPVDQICEHDIDGERDKNLGEYMYKNPLNDWSYVYLGYFIENDMQAMYFLKNYLEVTDVAGKFEDDIDVPIGKGNCGSDKLYRLREVDSLPYELKPIAKNAARIPVVIEWPENHLKPGGHVTFLDGHTEYMLYPGEFPMTEFFINALRTLDKLDEEIKPPTVGEM